MFFANVGGGMGGVEPSERLSHLAERVLWVMDSVKLASFPEWVASPETAGPYLLWRGIVK